MTMGKVRVLQILRGSGSFGGVASFLVSRYALIDREKIEFNFLFCQKDCLSDSFYNELIGRKNIFELSALKQKNTIKDYRELYNRLVKFFEEHKYDFIHINTGSLPVTYVCVKAANKSGMNNIIAHSHSSNYKNGILNTNILFKPIRKYLQYYIYKYSKYHFACSKAAAENMFGKKEYKLICNAIDVNKYDFDIHKRLQVRCEYGIGKEKVYGYIGRLSKSKNIDFIIKIFNCIIKSEPQAKLWIVGDGEEKEHLEILIKNYGLKNNIKLFGNRNDVDKLLQAMDAFIFPSLYEGLSLTVIEAQVSGLPVYLSNTLSIEHKITDNIYFLSLDDTQEKWSEAIRSNKEERKSHLDEAKKAGYNLKDSVKELQNFYLM